MKQLFTLLFLFTAAITFAAVAPLSSPQVGSSPSNGRVLQTNGATSTWVSTSSLGFPAGFGGTGTSSNIAFFLNSSTLTSDDHFYFNSSTDVLHIHKIAGDATDGLLIESEGGTDIGVLGAANTANVTWYGSHNFDAQTANTIASFGASKTLSSLATSTYPSLTELSYVKGVTSAIQTQLDSKPSFTYGSSTYVNYSYASSSFPSFSYASSSYVTVAGSQTVTGDKTFTGKTTLSNSSSTGISTANLFATGTVALATTTITGDLTLNGTFKPRVVGYASAASTTIDINTTDIATTTITATTTFVNPTGVVVDGQMFEIRAKATTTFGLFFGTNFASSTDLNNVTTIASGTTRWLFEYRQDVAKWELIGLLKGYIN